MESALRLKCATCTAPPCRHVRPDDDGDDGDGGDDDDEGDDGDQLDVDGSYGDACLDDYP